MPLFLVPLLVLLIGLVLYFAAGNAKISEVGRIAFFCGALALVFLYARLLR